MAGAIPQDVNGDTATTTLFTQVFFHIIESERLTITEAEKLKESLAGNGAEEHKPVSNGSKINFEGLTHIVSETIDFECYELATEQMVPVVKPSWVYSSIKKGRLANPRSHSPDPRLFFSGLVVCIADLPEGDRDAIIGGVVAMGGLYSSGVSKLVTHIVALTQDAQACQVAIAKELDCKMVLPHWFDDCLRLGRRIYEGPYLLPDPEIFRVEPHSHLKGTPRPELRDQISAHADSLPSPSNSPSKRVTVFEGRRVLLSDDLALSDHLARTLRGVIRDGGGKLVKDVSEANMLICQFREGQEFRSAASQNKTVGSLAWLYHLIRQNSWTNPMEKLLYYPIARYGLPGFEKYRISLSNYNGEARIYLETLAKAAGCEFTKTMKTDNTHLITAHLNSEKCEAAREWNVNMVNHLWLEESYAKWQIQSLANPRYVHFPPRTNLGEVVGQTPIDRKALERFFFPKSTKDTVRNDQVPALPSNHESTHSKTREDKLEGKIATPSKESFLAYRSKDDQGEMSSPLPQVREEHKSLIAHEAMQTPAPSSKSHKGKENETPSTGSRSAKEKAVARLHDMSSDIALYEKERKRVGGVVFGGKKSEDLVSRKSLRHSDSSDGEGVTTSASERHPKRQRTSTAPASMKLLVTGYSKWGQDHKCFVKDKERLRELGVVLTEDCEDCDLVAAPKIMRTRKFICAMAKGPSLVSTDYVDQCLTKNKLLQPEDYPLKDAEGERQYRMKLPEALERAKSNQGRLFDRQSIYVTESVRGGFDIYKAIVEANGGTCILFKGRAGLSFPARDDGHESVHVYLVSGATGPEAKLWPKFLNMAKQAGRTGRIVKTDWLLNIALSQEIRWDDDYAIDEADME